jgi:outer membrane protein, heavy metal efflux system
MRTLLALRAVAGTLVVLGATAARADNISLDEAVRRAARRPAVAMADADREAARSEATGARQPIYNPELGVSAGPKFSAGSTFPSVEVALAQTIELGGKRAARRDAADARVRVATEALDLAVLQAKLDAWRAFQLALTARARLETARDAEQLAAQVETAMRDSQTLGAGTQLQVNLTTAEVGRARHDRIDAENGYERALAELASVVGALPRERLEPRGELAAFPALVESEDQVVARALRARPELAVARAEVDAARANARLAGGLARPDLTMGVSYGYEEDPDFQAHTVLVSATIALPVRTRNQGGRAAARARERRAEIDQSRLRTDVEREARLALQTYQRARDAVLGFDREVNERLHDNLELARQSFEAGKIDYFEFNVVRRELVNSRLAYLDAVAEAIEAWHALQRAIGEERPS